MGACSSVPFKLRAPLQDSSRDQYKFDAQGCRALGVLSVCGVLGLGREKQKVGGGYTVGCYPYARDAWLKEVIQAQRFRIQVIVRARDLGLYTV